MNYENLTCENWLSCTLGNNTPMGLGWLIIILIGIGITGAFCILFYNFYKGKEKSE